MDAAAFIKEMEGLRVADAKSIINGFVRIIVDFDYQNLRNLRKLMGNNSPEGYAPASDQINLVLSLAHHIFNKYYRDESIGLKSPENLSDALYASCLLAFKEIYLEKVDLNSSHVANNRYCAAMLSKPLSWLNEVEKKFYQSIKANLGLLEWRDKYWPKAPEVQVLQGGSESKEVEAESLEEQHKKKLNKVHTELLIKNARLKLTQNMSAIDKSSRLSRLQKEQCELARLLDECFMMIRTLKKNHEPALACEFNAIYLKFLDTSIIYFEAQQRRILAGNPIDLKQAKLFKTSYALFSNQADELASRAIMAAKTTKATKAKPEKIMGIYSGAGRAF